MGTEPLRRTFHKTRPPRLWPAATALAILVASCSTAGTTVTSTTAAASTTSTSTSTALPTTPSPTTIRPGPGPAHVTEVIDGDTVRVDIAGQSEKVRLIGINTPEHGECLADAATARLTELAAGMDVTVVPDHTDRDQYGRLLRHLITADGTNLGEVMVAEGLAIARSYPPDTTLDQLMAAAQARAEAAGLGRWDPNACGKASTATVVIDAVNANPPGNDNLVPNEEWVSIRNTGPTGIDLTGWLMRDNSSSHRYPFPDGFVIGPTAVVTIHTGCGPDSSTDLHWCQSGSMIWNNSGDTAFLIDPAGNIHDTLSY